MGPRFCKRGNSVVAIISARCGPLQWGHAFVSLETGPDLRRYLALHEASMGPRFCKRGNTPVPNIYLDKYLASMGPRFCKRGNAGSQPPDWLALYALQWGHAFVSVETRQRRHPATPRRLLQWGHAFVSVETRLRRISLRPRIRFNGATLL